MTARIVIVMMSVLLLGGCQSGKDDWSNIDYSKIARENYRRENDPAYVPPTITGCTDDDLYNCPIVRPYR